MKWIKVKGKLFNAGLILSIERMPDSEAVLVKFSDGHYLDIAVSEYEKLMEFCGSEEIEIRDRKQ